MSGAAPNILEAAGAGPGPAPGAGRAAPRGWDLRLAGFAVAVWLSALAALHTGWRPAVGAAVGCAVACLALATAMGRPGRARRPRSGLARSLSNGPLPGPRSRLGAAMWRRRRGPWPSPRPQRWLAAAVQARARCWSWPPAPGRIPLPERSCGSRRARPAYGGAGTATPPTGGEPPRWEWVILAVLLGVVCGATATAARLAARDGEPLAGLARQRVGVLAELTVRSDPRRLAAPTGRPPTYLIPAQLSMVDTTGAGGPAGVVGGRAGTRPVAVVRLSARILVLAGDSAWAELLPGQRITARGRLGPARGGDLTAAVLSTMDPPDRVGAPPWHQRAAGALRAGLRRACGPLPDAPGGLLPGLVVGDTSNLDPTVEQEFRATGMTHLTAVSGSNVAVVVGAVLLLARWCRAGPALSAAACGIALVGFVILARPSPSVLRAAAMGGIGLLGLAGGRPRAALPALCAAVVLGVGYDPQLAGDPGFALSVLATAGLLLIAPGWRDALRRRGVPPGVAEALAVPAAAQAACAPVVAALSGAVSLVAVPANLLVTPAVAPATVLGVLAAVTAPLLPPVAGFAAWLGGWPAWWLVLVARWGAAVPAGVLPWPGGVGGGLLLACLTGAGLLLARYRLPRRLITVLAVAAVVGALPVRLVVRGWPPPGWTLVTCAVGQGDALAVPVGAGRAIVVDAGPDPNGVDRCLRRLGIHTVPLLFVSHYHADHVGGVAGVFRHRSVGAVVTADWHEPAAGQALVSAEAGVRGVPVRAARAGQVYRLGQVEVTVLGPIRPIRATRSDPNNNSLVVRVDAAGVRMLLTGDAEQEEQHQLLELAGAGQFSAPVLKLAHHGSAYQDQAFLDAVDPVVVLVSVGTGNPYGHPNPGVLRRLAGRGARVLRTDVDGDLAVVRTGTGLAVATGGLGPGP